MMPTGHSVCAALPEHRGGTENGKAGSRAVQFLGRPPQATGNGKVSVHRQQWGARPDLPQRQSPDVICNEQL
jgi:hypothetical protein